MRIKYDKRADALYVRLKASKIRRTIRIQDGLLVDVNEKGRVCGVELLHASEWLVKGERYVEVGEKKIPIPTFA